MPQKKRGTRTKFAGRIKLTKLVHEYGKRHRQLHCGNRFGKKMTVPVKW